MLEAKHIVVTLSYDTLLDSEMTVADIRREIKEELLVHPENFQFEDYDVEEIC